MKILSFFLSCFLCFISISAAWAVQVPKAAPGDSRVRFVPYDPANVVRVVGYFGFQTFILFSAGEIITDLGSGDTEAWSIGVVQAKNGFFIKPKGEMASTNLTVITTYRHYNFDLVQEKIKSCGAPSGVPFYMVRFTYPGDEAAKLAAKTEQEKVNQLLKAELEGKPINRNYWWDGSESLRPLETWDNGTFTYFRFAPGREFPSIFVMNEEDPELESTINLHVEGDTLVVHKRAQRFVLRLGNKATGVWNKSYTPIGVDLPGKTISPVIERQVRQ